MPKVEPEYLEQRRQQILDAAAACFARHGFHQATMQEICEEARLSAGAVYRYFRGKDEIIAAMCERAFIEDEPLVEAASAAADTRETFSELIRIFFLGFERSHTAEVCALVSEIASEAARNEAIRESLLTTQSARRKQFADLIAAAQARGDIDPALDPAAVARVMLSVYQGLVLQRLVEPDQVDIGAYAEVLRSLFCGTFWRRGGAAAVEGKETTPASRA